MPVLSGDRAEMSGAEHGNEDAADVRRVLDGDVAAFGGIVRRWHVRLLNLAWRFCRDRNMAEDMAQEAFVRAFRALDTFRGDAAFSTWLTAVALNSYPPLEYAAVAVFGTLAILGLQRTRRDLNVW